MLEKMTNLKLHVSNETGARILIFPTVEGITTYDIGIETDPGHFAVFAEITETRKQGSYELPANAPARRGYCVRAVKNGDVGDWSDLYYIPALSMKPPIPPQVNIVFIEETGKETPPGATATDKGPSRSSLLKEALSYGNNGIWLGILFLVCVALLLGLIGHSIHQRNAAQSAASSSGVAVANVAQTALPAVGAGTNNPPPATGRTFKATSDRVVNLPYDNYVSGTQIPESLTPGEDVTFRIAPGWDLFPTVDNADVTNCLVAYDNYTVPQDKVSNIPLIQKVREFRIRSFNPTTMAALTLVLTAPPKDTFKTY